MLAILAFLQRAVQRSLGLRRDGYGHNLERRARQYLADFQAPEESLRFKLALQNLLREYDLLDEEYALQPGPLELQLRVLELAERHPVAMEIAKGMFEAPIVAHLFPAILRNAVEEGATKIRVELANEDSAPLRVWFEKESSFEEMGTFPYTLREPLCGMFRRAEAAGYERLLPYFESSEHLPKSVRFEWISESAVEVVVD